MKYGKNLLIAIDQLLNAVFAGYPDETLSARAWRWSRDGKRDWPRSVLDFIFGANHCQESYVSERVGRQRPPELRTQ